MLFSSAAFIFIFLPLVFVGFVVTRRIGSPDAVIYWLIASSTFFYGWWNPRYLLLIGALLGANFGASRAIAAADTAHLRKTWLMIGLAANLGALLYFKYTTFLLQVGNNIAHTHLYIDPIILPLGISFFTFQKIAFLIDTYYGRTQRVKFSDYCLFVLFFPQLIAGPIVHHAEVVPQFRRLHDTHRSWDHVALGLSLFFIGLFKKVVLADSLAAEDVSPVFGATAAGATPFFLEAWGGVVGYTLELYFDFSGYSDMAIGAALLFGIRLPQNFNSPFKAASIIDFWRRWHITLTRFLTAYVYNPFSLWLTRRRVAKGLKGVGGKDTTVGAFIVLLMWPTLLTLFLSGLWHGAGYTYVIWGLLHGIFLVVNHAWRFFLQVKWPNRDRTRYQRLMRPFGVALTFLCVAASMAFFRANSVAEAVTLLRAMTGAYGIQLPTTLGSEAYGHIHGGWHLIALLALLAWCLLLPNAQQMFSKFPTALGTQDNEVGAKPLTFDYQWRWVAFIATTVLVGLLYVQSNIAQEFIYFDF